MESLTREPSRAILLISLESTGEQKNHCSLVEEMGAPILFLFSGSGAYPQGPLAGAEAAVNDAHEKSEWDPIFRSYT